MFKKALALLVILVAATAARAQPVSNPTKAVFSASSDHNTVDGVTGASFVTSYELDAVAMNSIGAIALTVNLGKPTPDGANTITAAVPLLSTLTKGALYTAVIKAIGPGGANASAASNPFGIPLPSTAPAPPGTPQIK